MNKTALQRVLKTWLADDVAAYTLRFEAGGPVMAERLAEYHTAKLAFLMTVNVLALAEPSACMAAIVMVRNAADLLAVAKAQVEIAELAGDEHNERVTGRARTIH